MISHNSPNGAEGTTGSTGENSFRRFRRTGGALLSAAILLPGCSSDTDAVPPPTPTDRVTTTTSTPSTTEAAPIVTPEKTTEHETLDTSIDRIIDVAAGTIERADTTFVDTGRYVWESGDISFLAQFDDSNIITRLSGGPKNENEAGVSFSLDFAPNEPCVDGVDATCLSGLKADDAVYGIAGFIDGRGNNANVEFEERDGDTYFAITKGGKIEYDEDEAEAMWNDISQALAESATAAGEPTPEPETTSEPTPGPTPESASDPESLDSQIDTYISATIGVMLESLTNNPPRQLEPYKITNRPENSSTIKPGETYVIATYLTDTQQLSFNVGHEDNNSIESVGFTVNLTRKNPMLVAQAFDVNTLKDALASFGVEDEQKATVFLANATVEGIKLKDGAQTSAYQLNVSRLYSGASHYEMTLDELPDPSAGGADVVTGITDKKIIEKFLEQSIIS